VKYVLMFMETEEFARELDAMSLEERDSAFQQVDRWFADHADKIRGGAKLKGPETATTVRLDAPAPIVTDGPFIEGKEVISGFTLIEADDFDEVLRIAKEWPGCPVVEIRPLEA
jgi:hypothetical protein